MKYLYTIVSMAIISIALIAVNPQTGHSNATGAPSGNAGSPLDGGSTCAQVGCHGGSAEARANMITTDIPASGYVPGTQYNITAQVAEAGVARFGFQVSPQLQNGGQAGIMAAVDGNTQSFSAKYITHTFAGTSAVGTKTWTFKWTAPTAGSGPVTFYGAFVAANNNGSADASDKIFKSSTTVSEAGHLGVKNIAAAGMNVYPLPFANTLTVEKGIQQFETAAVKLYTLDGKLVAETTLDAAQLNTTHLASGIYILKIEGPGLNVVQKVVK